MNLGLQADHIKNQNRFFAKELRKETTDLKNRILSIHQDSLFVRSVQNRHLDLALVPNLRCGGWYTPPALSRATAYFKSTDGHSRQWRFSLKRSNLHLVNLIQQQGGIILVDSTRRGKSIPDALSKTVPIWCSVLNEASFRKYSTPSTAQIPCEGFDASRRSRNFASEKKVGGRAWLMTPQDVVGESEHEQIAERIDGWVQELLASDLPIPRLEIPLLPIFLTPVSFHCQALSPDPGSGLASESRSRTFHPLILLSASHAIDSGQTQSSTLFPSSRTGQFTYVQGAGDDHESWSQGLTPTMFWNPGNHELLMECGRDEIESKVKEIVEQNHKSQNGLDRWFIPSGDTDETEKIGAGLGENGPTHQDDRVGQTTIYLGQRNLRHRFDEAEKSRYSLIIDCSTRTDMIDEEKAAEAVYTSDDMDQPAETRIIRLGIESGKKGVNQFAHSLPRAIKSVESFHSAKNTKPKGEGQLGSKPELLICSTDGKDLPASFAIAILALFFDDAQSPLSFNGPDSSAKLAAHRKSLTKASIQKRLQWVVTSNPSSIPSRTHLKRINEWLLSPGGGRYG